MYAAMEEPQSFGSHNSPAFGLGLLTLGSGLRLGSGTSGMRLETFRLGLPRLNRNLALFLTLSLTVILLHILTLTDIMQAPSVGVTPD